MTARHRNITIGVVIVLALVAIFTNPSQATHLKAIQETIALRKGDQTVADLVLKLVEYHNYGVFSTTSFGDVMSYGCFGTVQTTDKIKDLLIPKPSP